MNEREKMRLWVETWKRAGPELEAIRLEEIREADNIEDLKALESAFNHALASSVPEPTSGLVDMQMWLAKLPR